MKEIIGRGFWLFCFCFLLSVILSVHPAPAQREKREILIGAHLPLSGDGSLVGAEQKWAYDRAVEDINKKGGIYVREYRRRLPVRLVAIDDETDPIKAAAAVERLITQNKVDLLLSGQVGALGVIDGMLTAEKYHKYYHGTVIWVPDFLAHNFQWCTMYFVAIQDTAIMPFEVWNTLPKNQRPTKIGLFMEDSMDGKQMGDGLAALAEQYGYEPPHREVMPIGGRDFSSQIIRTKAAGVDAIILFSNVPETVILVRQMKEIGFNFKFFQGYKGTWAPDFYSALGRDADYVMCDGFWSEDYPFRGAKELGRRYYDDFGKRSVGAGMYYAVCQILFQAIEEAGTLDSARVRQAALDNTFETVNGSVDYDETGVALFHLGDLQWRNGVREVVYPFDFAKTKARIAPPWNRRR